MPNTQKSGRFQSTPSVWRETCCGQDEGTHPAFQSTPSVWRETQPRRTEHAKRRYFNPLPPCGGRLDEIGAGMYLGISIHSLRVEGDAHRTGLRGNMLHFNPLPPCGGRPAPALCALRGHNFNPLPPCGGRLLQLLIQCQQLDFNPLPPCGGRLYQHIRKRPDTHNFNPLPPCGGRHCQQSKTGGGNYFNPLPPCGGRRIACSTFYRYKAISIHSLRVEGDKTC